MAASVGSVNFGGLASGLDTNQIISDLMTIETQPLTRLEDKQSEVSEKRDTFTTMRSMLLDLQTAASGLKSASSFGTFSASSSDEEALVVSATTSASEGNYSVKILSLAQAETLSSNSFSSTSTDLGLSGEIVLNTNSITIRATDSLIDIRNGINALNDGVNASILKISDSDYRLILSSEDQGEEGFSLGNVGGGDALQQLGFVDDTASVRKVEDGNVLSLELSSANSTIGSLLDISSEAAGTVTIRNKSVSIDLGNDTLSSIRDKINDLGVQGVSATIETVTNSSSTSYRLAISGTQEFEDDNNVLETIGILERGTGGTYAEFSSSTLYASSNGHGGWQTDSVSASEISSNTKLTSMGAETGETITISGTDVDGSSVSGTINVSHSTSVSNILDQIESIFNDNVTASVEDGKLTVTSNVAGTTSLSFSIDAGNENGGTLDFGTVSTVTEGRDRLLAEGQNSTLVVNNIQVSRDSNDVSDVITGLKLSLREADVDTTLNITVERDRDTIKEKILDFVSVYNDYMSFYNVNTDYDSETEQAGLLLGDITARTAQSLIQDVLRGTVYGEDMAYSQLIQIGIETTTEGKLEIDSSKLNDALNDDIDSVIELFTATRESSDNDIIFVYHSDKTEAGTYDVNITQAAEKAAAASEVINGATGKEGTINITDNYDRSLSIDFDRSMKLEDIASSINEEASTSYSEIKKSDTAMISADGAAAKQNTAISALEGVTVGDGDTVTVIATNSSGREYERIIELDDTTTIQNILDEVEDMNDQQVIASIDSSGQLMVEDIDTGKSRIALSITSTIDSLNFGTFSTYQQGRSSVIINAEVTSDGRLEISHQEYGSNNTFTIEGAEDLGIKSDTYAGVDVAGTINGYEGVGNGQSLSASNEDEQTKGIIIKTAITAAELAVEGSEQGSITLISGIGDALYGELSSMTSSVDGFIQAKIDSIDISLDSLDEQMDRMEVRLEQTRASLERKYTQLEIAMSQLQTLQQTLSSQLGSLGV